MVAAYHDPPTDEAVKTTNGLQGVTEPDILPSPPLCSTDVVAGDLGVSVPVTNHGHETPHQLPPLTAFVMSNAHHANPN